MKPPIPLTYMSVSISTNFHPFFSGAGGEVSWFLCRSVVVFFRRENTENSGASKQNPTTKSRRASCGRAKTKQCLTKIEGMGRGEGGGGGRRGETLETSDGPEKAVET